MKAPDVRQLTTAAMDQLIAAVDGGKSVSLKAYLAMLGRFRRYSLGNVLLIAMQRPDATHVAGYTTWKRLGRQVKRGERGIRILEPIVRRTHEADDKDDVDTEEELVAFRSASVFDVSQTEGKELPEPTRAVGDPKGHLDRLKTFIAERGICLEYSDTLRAEGAATSGRIILRSGLASADQFSTTVHELAHSMLHFGTDVNRQETRKKVLETEAEAVAFVVSQAIGLDATKASADYIQLYSGDRETLVRSLERIQATAGEIIDAILPVTQPGPCQTPT